MSTAPRLRNLRVRNDRRGRTGCSNRILGDDFPAGVKNLPSFPNVWYGALILSNNNNREKPRKTNKRNSEANDATARQASPRGSRPSGPLPSESGLAAEGGAWAVWSGKLQKTLLSKPSRFPVSHLPVAALLCWLRSSCVLVRERLKRKNKLLCFSLICTDTEPYLALRPLPVPLRASTAGPVWGRSEPTRVPGSSYFNMACGHKFE